MWIVSTEHYTVENYNCCIVKIKIIEKHIHHILYVAHLFLEILFPTAPELQPLSILEKTHKKQMFSDWSAKCGMLQKQLKWQILNMFCKNMSPVAFWLVSIPMINVFSCKHFLSFSLHNSLYKYFSIKMFTFCGHSMMQFTLTCHCIQSRLMFVKNDTML